MGLESNLESKIEELEQKCKDLELELELYKKLPELIEVASKVGKLLDLKEESKEFLTYIMNNTIRIVGDYLGFRDGSVGKFYLKAQDKTLIPFSNLSYSQLNEPSTMYVQELTDLSPSSVDLHDNPIIMKARAPPLFILRNHTPWQSPWDDNSFEEQLAKGMIDSGHLERMRHSFNMALYQNICQILGLEDKRVEMDKYVRQFQKSFLKSEDVRMVKDFDAFINSRMSELRQHPEFDRAMEVLLARDPYYRSFEEWGKSVIFPISESMLLELYSPKEWLRCDQPIPEDKMAIGAVMAKFLEIPLTSAVLMDELRKSQEEVIESKLFRRDELLAGEIAHLVRNKLHPARSGLLKIRGFAGRESLLKQICELVGNLDIELGTMGAKLNSILSMYTDYIDESKRVEFVNEVKSFVTMSNLRKEVKDVVKERVEKVEFFLDRVFTSIDKTLWIISRVFDYTKPEDYDFREVDLAKVVQGVYNHYQAMFQQKGIKANIEVDNVKFYGSEQKIEEMLDELVKNAIDAMESSPVKELIIKVASSEDYATVSVKDTGCGIRPEDYEKIFDPMYSTKPTDGLGLGLANVNKIIKVHRGKKTVVSEVGGGAEFVVYLPKKGEEE